MHLQDRLILLDSQWGGDSQRQAQNAFSLCWGSLSNTSLRGGADQTGQGEGEGEHIWSMIWFKRQRRDSSTWVLLGSMPCVGELIWQWCPIHQDSSSMVSPLPCDSAYLLARVLWVKLTSCHGTTLEEKSESIILYMQGAWYFWWEWEVKVSLVFSVWDMSVCRRVDKTWCPD